MTESVELGVLPAIIVGDLEYERLSGLAEAALQRVPETAASLLFELDRASVVRAEEVPPGVVRLGSAVTFCADGGEPRRVILVMPGDADISRKRISVLTPIGAALIGLRAGQSITWAARDGKRHRLQVLSVHHDGGELRP